MLDYRLRGMLDNLLHRGDMMDHRWDNWGYLRRKTLQDRGANGMRREKGRSDMGLDNHRRGKSSWGNHIGKYLVVMDWI
jgi:hypothetical protein